MYTAPTTVCSSVQWPCRVQQIALVFETVPLVIICLVGRMHNGHMQEGGWGITAISALREVYWGDEVTPLCNSEELSSGLSPSVPYSLMKHPLLHDCLIHSITHLSSIYLIIMYQV